MKNKLLFKIALFNLSLIPLYLIFIIQYIDISTILNFSEYENIAMFGKELLIINIKILFFILLIIIGFLSLLVFNKNNNYNREKCKKV